MIIIISAFYQLRSPLKMADPPTPTPYKIYLEVLIIGGAVLPQRWKCVPWQIVGRAWTAWIQGFKYFLHSDVDFQID